MSTNTYLPPKSKENNLMFIRENVKSKYLSNIINNYSNKDLKQKNVNYNNDIIDIKLKNTIKHNNQTMLSKVGKNNNNDKTNKRLFLKNENDNTINSIKNASANNSRLSNRNKSNNTILKNNNKKYLLDKKNIISANKENKISLKYSVLQDKYIKLKSENANLLKNKIDLDKKIAKIRKKESMYDDIYNKLNIATNIIIKIEKELNQSELIRTEQAELIKKLQQKIIDLENN